MNPHLLPLLLGKKSLAGAVIAILRKYGTDAHVYLPGIGVINGLTAGNYLESTGITAATVDTPVGLVLDANGSVGAETVINGDNVAALFAGASTVNGSVAKQNAPDGTASAAITCSGGLTAHHITAPVAANKAYKFSCRVWIPTGTIATARLFDAIDGSWFGSTSTVKDGWVTLTGIRPVGKAASWLLGIGDLSNANIDGLKFYATDISIKEVTGIHATQATTANKPILRYASGRYYFDFVDGTDVLNATYPAGWESVTTIDAAPTGQATLTAQNIVGTYAITTDTYGRFVFKTITASELAIVQSYCNRLAGV